MYGMGDGEWVWDFDDDIYIARSAVTRLQASIYCVHCLLMCVTCFSPFIVIPVPPLLTKKFDPKTILKHLTPHLNQRLVLRQPPHASYHDIR